MHDDAGLPLRERERIPVSNPRTEEERAAMRHPINIDPDTRERLRQFLMYGPGAGTGIGFSEFIEQSMRLWESLEHE